MNPRSLLRLLILSLLLPLVCGPSLYAQEGGDERPDPPLPSVTRAFAIRNARIVQAPGKVIQKGTVVMRNGVITAVGPNVPIPYDAQIIEGDSLTVYAGFIDGLSHAGVPKPKGDSKENDKVERPGEPPNDRAGIQPERDVRGMLASTDASLDSLRMAGFTVSHVVPRGRMLPGSGAIVLLSGRNPADMVLRGNASLFAQFEPAEGDVYPSTIFAIMAKWRTLYRDAERKKRGGSIYNENPDGVERPRFDAVSDAFRPVIDGNKPVFFRTETTLDVHRAMKLRDDLKFPLVIAGLKEGWDLAATLKSADLPVFVSLDFPKEKKEEKNEDSTTAADSSKGVTPPPPDDYFLRDERTSSYKDIVSEKKRLEFRQGESRTEYYAGAGRLNREGVRFGFATLGAASADLRGNIRLAVQNGLPEDAALAALTVEPARLLGLDRNLGTVEQGNMANLVVTNGSYFDKKSSVRFVFVDGEKFEYEAKKDEKKDTALAADTARRVRGLDTLRANPALAGRRDPEQRGNVLIRNGTVLTVTGGTLTETDILVENGRIARIGKGLTAPAGFDTIDATGEFVMPGIIDAHSHSGTTDVNEWTSPVTAEVAIGDVLDPYDLMMYRALGGGKTVSHVMHGSANVIGGQCQTIKLRYGVTDPEGLVMKGAPRTIKFALGENPTRVHGRGFGVNPSTRMGVEQVLRDAFTKAQRYMMEQQKYEKEKKNPRAVPPAYDLRMETLAAILRGEILIHCHSYRADEILMLMRVLKDFGVTKVTFQHVNEGFKVAPELAQFGASASVFADWWAYKFEVYYSTAYNAAILTRNGVVASINSDSPELDRHLYHEAAKTRRYGNLTEEEALALITINPARQLGIENRVGSIEVGKEADIAIFTAHPLSIYAICRKTLVDGVVRFDRDNDPDDMRLRVDPKSAIETSTVWHEHEDRCMQGTEGLMELLKSR